MDRPVRRHPRSTTGSDGADGAAVLGVDVVCPVTRSVWIARPGTGNCVAGASVEAISGPKAHSMLSP
jgi:hypothetical protein